MISPHVAASISHIPQSDETYAARNDSYTVAEVSTPHTQRAPIARTCTTRGTPGRGGLPQALRRGYPPQPGVPPAVERRDGRGSGEGCHQGACGDVAAAGHHRDAFAFQFGTT